MGLRRGGREACRPSDKAREGYGPKSRVATIGHVEVVKVPLTNPESRPPAFGLASIRECREAGSADGAPFVLSGRRGAGGLDGSAGFAVGPRLQRRPVRAGPVATGFGHP